MLSKHKELSILALGLLLLITFREAIYSQANPASPNNSQYVQRGQLWPQLRAALNKVGDRLEKLGKERVILNGTLSRLTGPQTETIPIQLILEYPNRLRLEEQVGNRVRVTVFNSYLPANTNGLVNRRDEDLIETLVFDSIDHFLTGQTQGLSMRSLGMRFRTDDGSTLNYQGPFYDIYQLNDQFRMGPAFRQRPKLYFLNSNTQLLERVTYQLASEPMSVDVEVQLSNWSSIGGYYLPGSISRTENSQPIFTLVFNSASFASRAEDGIFDRP